MTNLRKAAQQALDWLYENDIVHPSKVSQDLRTALEQQAEPVCMRMPRVGDRVICLEDESLGEVVSLTAGGSPDIAFDDGSCGTYMLREFAELFGYVTPPQRKPMTDEAIWQIATDCTIGGDLHADKFTRAIEAAHGIGDKT